MWLEIWTGDMARYLQIDFRQIYDFSILSFQIINRIPFYQKGSSAITPVHWFDGPVVFGPLVHGQSLDIPEMDH